MEPSSKQNLPAIRNEPVWKQLYQDKMEDKMESCQDSPAPKLSPKLAPLEDISKPATPEEKDASSDEPIQETVEPTAVFPASSTILENRSALGNILAPVSRDEPVIKEIRASPQPTTHTPRAIPQGKATRHDVSASDAKLTEAIKAALVGARISENDDRRLHKSLDKNGLLHANNTAGHSWLDPVKASATSNGDINHADSSSLQEDSKDSQAQKKAIEVLKTLHDLGYIIQRDTSLSPKPQNPGSAASCKSENVVTCQKCGKFKGRPCELK